MGAPSEISVLHQTEEQDEELCDQTRGMTQEEQILHTLDEGWQLKRTLMGRLGISQYRWWARAIQTVCQISFFPLMVLMILEQIGVFGQEVGIGYAAAGITLTSFIMVISLIDLQLVRTMFRFANFTISIILGICVPILCAICTRGSLRAYLSSGFGYGLVWPLVDCMDLERVRRTRRFLGLMMTLSTVGLVLVAVNVFEVDVFEIYRLTINGVDFSYSFRDFFMEFTTVQLILGWKQILAIYFMDEVDYYFASKPIRRTR